MESVLPEIFNLHPIQLRAHGLDNEKLTQYLACGPNYLITTILPGTQYQTYQHQFTLFKAQICQVLCHDLSYFSLSG